MFKQTGHLITRMTHNELSDLIEINPLLCFAAEVKVVFSDKAYLDEICTTLLNKHITGYNITENETSYSWEGSLYKNKNYVASTIIPLKELPTIFAYFNDAISKKWKTPLIQVLPCFINSKFHAYLTNAGARIHQNEVGGVPMTQSASMFKSGTYQI